MDLKLKFDAGLPHQRAAIDATVGLFAGQPLADSGLTVSFNAGPLLPTELGLGNRLVLDDAALLANLRAVQAANGIAQAAVLRGRDFAVEMETGTGKTYVYLRTAFELHARYGFAKFVIVVPSIAIREGVLHSLETMGEHFRALYATNFEPTVYDSKQPGRLRSFATANTLQFLVINIQAFQRDAGEAAEAAGNVIYRSDIDRFFGHRPIDFLRHTRPIVIVDEPQKLAGAASQAAVGRLDPLCTLRYSATHPPDGVPTIYKLGPMEAFDLKLVKKIEVASVVAEENTNAAFVRLLKTDIRTQTADLRINVGDGSTVTQKTVRVRPRDDLAVKSIPRRGGAGRQEYRDGWIVQAINFGAGDESVSFTNGARIEPGAAAGSLDDDVMREQVRQTVREHFEKERRLRPRGIKVLSLVFLDRGASYREYAADGGWTLGKAGRWFEEAFAETAAQPAYAGLIPDPVAAVHGGYFAEDKRTGAFKDSADPDRRRQNQDDESAYSLIMRDKERLLSFETPLRFVFSHSALREGWDNPNVFQICTLNESRSPTRKRQEIGRGLRLPVNQAGERIHDEGINRLTVVANESYRAFAAQLQAEYEETEGPFGRVAPEAFADIARPGSGEGIGQPASRRLWDALRRDGYLAGDGVVTDTFAPKAAGFALALPAEFAEQRAEITDVIASHLFRTRVVEKRQRRTIEVRRNVLADEAFVALWQTVARRTRYRVTLDGERLVAAAIARMQSAPAILAPTISIETRELRTSAAGFEAEAPRWTTFEEVRRAEGWPIPDVLAYLQNETELTRRTLVRILVESGRAEDLAINPQAFVTMATDAIRGALREELLPGLVYEPLADQAWEATMLEGEQGDVLDRYLDNLYEVQNARKTPFDYVEYQSEVERRFAEELDCNERIARFVKLPKRFVVDTPLGPYNPDWAILTEPDPGETTGRLVLVRETKGTTATQDLRQSEQDKIHCGRKHFAAIDVNFDVTTGLDDTLRRLSMPAPAEQQVGIVG